MRVAAARWLPQGRGHRRPGPPPQRVARCSPACAVPARLPAALLRLPPAQQPPAVRFKTLKDLRVPAARSGAALAASSSFSSSSSPRLLRAPSCIAPHVTAARCGRALPCKRQPPAAITSIDTSFASRPEPGAILLLAEAQGPFFPAGRSSVSLFAASAVIYKPSVFLAVPWEPREPKLPGRAGAARPRGGPAA